MGKVVGVRFQRGGKVYDFDAGHFVLSLGDKVIVETEQGLALGSIARLPELRETEDGQIQEVCERPEDAPALKKVYRLATEADLAQLESNAKLEEEAHAFCLERVGVRDMEMNLVKVESFFDRSKIIFYFTADGRLDFRELVRDLVGRFRTRIEMRQIGVRHEAKLLGGLGSCGRELCCATFLRDFEPVSVKMAKEQNLSLNPTKISGLCGRLMCCLTYEYQAYHDLKKGLPKLGKRINLDEEKRIQGKVIRQNVLKRQVTVLMPDGKELTGTPEELAKNADEPEQAPSRPAAPPPEDPMGKGQDYNAFRPMPRQKPVADDATTSVVKEGAEPKEEEKAVFESKNRRKSESRASRVKTGRTQASQASPRQRAQDKKSDQSSAKTQVKSKSRARRRRTKKGPSIQ